MMYLLWRSFNISYVGIRPMNIMNADRTVFPISEDWIRTKSLTPTAFWCHTYLKFGNTLRGFSSIYQWHTKFQVATYRV